MRTGPARALVARLLEFLDVRSGLAGGALLAGSVFAINFSHGLGGASTAAAKQFAYTFCMGAVIMRLCTRLALRPGSALRVMPPAIVLPSVVTIGATFLVHSLKGTPEPLLSTLPVALISPPTFVFWARHVRRSGQSPWARIGGSKGRN